MEKPVYGFFISLFNLLLVYIVFANFLGWSGGALSLTGYNVDWSNSYVGFQSLTMAVNDFQAIMDLPTISISGTTYHVAQPYMLRFLLNRLINAITFGLPNLITKITNSSMNLIDVVVFLYTIFAQPLLVFIYTSLCVVFVLYWIIGFITIFFKFCGGAYNLTFSNTDEIWSQWSSLSSEWDWDSILQPNVM